MVLQRTRGEEEPPERAPTQQFEALHLDYRMDEALRGLGFLPGQPAVSAGEDAMATGPADPPGPLAHAPLASAAALPPALVPVGPAFAIEPLVNAPAGLALAGEEETFGEHGGFGSWGYAMFCPYLGNRPRLALRLQSYRFFFE